jgi:hypothetical protein
VSMDRGPFCLCRFVCLDPVRQQMFLTEYAKSEKYVHVPIY